MGAAAGAPPRLLALVLLLSVAANRSLALGLDPCAESAPISRGEPFVVGLAYWPGGLVDDWGAADAALHPCNATHRAALSARGAHFAAFAARADRLAALKTTFPDELFLAGANPDAAAPKVISVVAFRHDVRSEPRYIASFESQVTSGTGFVGSLSLVAAFDPPAAGRLSHLLWWNLTCADCGGAASERCLGATACALPAAACTCAGGGGSALPSSTPAPLDAASGSEAAAPPPARRRRGLKQDGVSQADGGGATAATTAATAPPPAPPEATCDFGSLSICATTINLAFEGVDAKSRAFTTAGAIRSLNSYSLLRLYSAGKDRFFSAVDAWSGPANDAWSRFRDAQDQLAAAYTEGPDSGRITGSSMNG